MSCCCPGATDRGAIAGAAVASDPRLLASLGPVVVNNALLNTIPLVTGGIPANLLADRDVLRVVLSGMLTQSNAAPQTWFVGISLGGVVLWGAVTAAYAISATVRAWSIECSIRRVSVAAATLGGFAALNNSVVASTNGLGTVATAPQGGPIGSAVVDPVVNWAAVQALELGVQASVAALNFTLRSATVELLRAP